MSYFDEDLKRNLQHRRKELREMNAALGYVDLLAKDIRRELRIAVSHEPKLVSYREHDQHLELALLHLRKANQHRTTTVSVS